MVIDDFDYRLDYLLGSKAINRTYHNQRVGVLPYIDSGSADRRSLRYREKS